MEAHVGLIGTILIGLVAGALAKLIMPGKQGGGWIMTILLGIAGSLVATMLGRAVGWYQEGEGAQFIGSIVGAIIILIVYGFFKKKSA